MTKTEAPDSKYQVAVSNWVRADYMLDGQWISRFVGLTQRGIIWSVPTQRLDTPIIWDVRVLVRVEEAERILALLTSDPELADEPVTVRLRAQLAEKNPLGWL